LTPWRHPDGLKDYLTALGAFVDPHDPYPVAQAAGLSAADWYRRMLTRTP
jgi:hypothetical protein